MECELNDDAPEGQSKTLVLLCQSLNSVGDGLGLAEIRRWFQAADPAVGVEVVVDLCYGPDLSARIAAAGAGRLVLGLCSSDHAEVDVDVHLRKAGLDPLGVERVNLGGHCALPYPRAEATDKAKALLAAAVARARAFPGSGPESVRPHLVRGQQRLSRRALFTLPTIRYQPVASVHAERCAGEPGCQLCVEVCPADALAKSDGRVLPDKGRCQACGLCVVECPRAAVELPDFSLPQLEAEMTTLLRTPALPPSLPRSILFVCGQNASVLENLGRRGISYPLGWLPVHVPCAGAVSVSWLLGCLAWGAKSVGLLACDGDCPFEQGERIEGTVAYCRELLGLLGGSPEDVRLLRPSPEWGLAEALSRPLERGARSSAGEREVPSLIGPQAAADAIQTLSEAYGTSPVLSFAHRFSPLGLVQIDADKCTACAGCARACPTGALAFYEDEGAVCLDFDPALCTACQQCSGWCPEASEQAVRIDKVTDLQALSQGRVRLYQDGQVQCESCGEAIGPTAMLRRIETLLTHEGNTSAAAMAMITRRCPSCRVAGVAGSRPFAGS